MFNVQGRTAVCNHILEHGSVADSGTLAAPLDDDAAERDLSDEYEESEGGEDVGLS